MWCKVWWRNTYAVYNLWKLDKETLVHSIHLKDHILRSRARTVVFVCIDGFWFMQDDTRPHRIKEIVELLAEHFRARVRYFLMEQDKRLIGQPILLIWIHWTNLCGATWRTISFEILHNHQMHYEKTFLLKFGHHTAIFCGRLWKSCGLNRNKRTYLWSNFFSSISSKTLLLNNSNFWLITGHLVITIRK